MRADFSCQPQRRPSHINFSIATNRCDSLSYRPYLSAASSILLPGWLLRCCLEWIGSGNDGLKWIWAPVALLKKIGKTCGQCNCPSQQANQALRILVVHNTSQHSHKRIKRITKETQNCGEPVLVLLLCRRACRSEALEDRISFWVEAIKGPLAKRERDGKGSWHVLTSPNFSCSACSSESADCRNCRS